MNFLSVICSNRNWLFSSKQCLHILLYSLRSKLTLSKKHYQCKLQFSSRYSIKSKLTCRYSIISKLTFRYMISVVRSYPNWHFKKETKSIKTAIFFPLFFQNVPFSHQSLYKGKICSSEITFINLFEILKIRVFINIEMDNIFFKIL